MSQQVSPDSQTLWHRLVESDNAFHRAWMDFFAEGVDRVPWVREGLRSRDRFTALSVVPYLTLPERMQLFSDLVSVARAAHGPVEAVWNLILALPRDWVLAHIEQEVEPILEQDEEDDYWMFLQLYERLDRDLTLRLAHRAAKHSDPDIRELGEDSLQRLSDPQANADQHA